jgi:predicted CXXCH cytochrome family protein
LSRKAGKDFREQNLTTTVFQEERMRKLLATMLCIALGMLLFASYAFAIAPGYTGETPVTAGTGINGTVHDLRRHNTLLGYKSANQSDYLDRLCIFCHAPHHTYRPSTAGAVGTGPLAPADYTYLPLWNHTVTQQAFTPYFNGPDQPSDGPKRAQSIDFFDRIGASSLLCLSCHDGTVAVNEFGNAPQDTRSISRGSAFMTTQYRIGADGYLANHHPIGFPYDAVAALDPEIFESSIAVYDHTLDSAVGNPGTATVPVEPISNFLWGGKMECTTCHAVHNKGNTGEKLLYVSDQNSNLCFSCHNKGTKTDTGVTP